MWFCKFVRGSFTGLVLPVEHHLLMLRVCDLRSSSRSACRCLTNGVSGATPSRWLAHEVTVTVGADGHEI